MTELLRGIPPLLASHLELVLIALALAASISLPLAVVVAARPRLAFVIVTTAGVIQTVPGLALLALMVPVLATTGLLSPFGFPPAVIGLTLYAILPILRNAVTGLRGVDPATVEAARGMGLSPWQIMRVVQLPLAAPVIAAGIRTATVWTVGAATLATPVGQPCLGNYIFAGLQTRNFSMLLVGVAVAATLAVILDALLGATEHALAGRRRRRALIPLGLLAALVVIINGVLPRLVVPEARIATATSTTVVSPTAITRVRIGGKTFTEQYVLVELIRARLEQHGIAADLTQSLGSTVAFDAIVNGDIDVYVDYSGTLWTNAMKRDAGLPRWQLLAELEGWLAREHRVRSLGALGFENTYGFAVRRETATRLGLRTLADLARHPELAIGGDYEFFSRPEWASVKRTYGLRFGRDATFDPTLLYEALARGEVDVITAFSSDGRIAAFDLVVLEDPAGALPPYDAMIMLGARVAADRRVSCVLGSLRVDVDQMRRANALVDRDGKPAQQAATWLLEQQLAVGDCGEL
ncbi:MAG: ABC transporter permease/substrate-binding protein [Deltaproteobacteria bacterium]|nr:ABC transporter permease/substrate-binding protein [Deltaproteobacteria bacterium]MDQ3298366.1 ABC transporter permease/substrate-binding protein [Myxococcota bacterium]